MKKIVVYGSLRKGEYNFEAFKRIHGDAIKHVKTTEIEGFQLHSLGAFPCAVPKEGKKLTVDVLEVSDQVDKSIYNMEAGAGYHKNLVKIDGEKLPIYIYHTCNAEVIEHGDWSKRNTLKHYQLLNTEP